MNYQARIVRNFLWVSSFLFLAKLAGAAKEMATAWRFGTSAILDDYLFALTILSWMPVIVISILSIVVVPVLAKAKADNTYNQQQFQSELLGFLTLIGAGLSVFIFVGALFDYSGIISVQTRTFLRYLALLPILIILAGYVTILVQAQEKYLVSLAEAIPAVIMLIAIFLISDGWLLLVLGTLAGYLVSLLAVILLSQRAGISFSLRFSFSSEYWRLFWSGMGVMVASQVLMSFVLLLDASILSQMEQGALATFGYATRIIMLFVTLGAVAISRAILPVISQLTAEGKEAKARSLTLRSAALFFALALIGSVALWFLSPVIIRLLFERGEFSAQDTQNVARTLQFGLVQLPFYFAGIVFVQYLASKSRYVWIAVGAALNLPVKYLANVYLGESMGPAGIAFATSLMYIFSCLFLLLGVVRRTAR